MALTDLAVRKLLPPETGQLRIFDTNMPAFGVTVGKRTKTFIVVRGQKRQLTTIGRYPEISLFEARKEARRLLSQVTQEKRATGLVEAVTAFLDDCQTRLRPKSIRAYKTVLQNAPDILLAEANRKTVTVNTPHEIKAYKALLNWCLAEDLADRNPFAHLTVSFNQRERVLTDEELRQIWRYEDGRYSVIIRLLILTGQRVGEITKIQPSWIDGDTLTIPSEVAKNKRTHTIPFNLLTAHYLKQHQYFNGYSKSKARLDAKLQLDPWRLHDLRRTFSTNHAALGTPIHVTERLLNHVSGTISGVSATYNRYNYLKEMREASRNYELHLTKILDL